MTPPPADWVVDAAAERARVAPVWEALYAAVHAHGEGCWVWGWGWGWGM